MVPTACVKVHHYALQILLCTRPELRRRPCVVVSEDLPHGTVLDLNRTARDAGVRRGMRFAVALSLLPSLRAGTVSAQEQRNAGDMIRKALYRVSPQVESYRRDPGVFWVGTAGMERVFSSQDAWINACRDTLREAGFEGRIILGWTRAGTYVSANGSDKPARVFPSFQEELVEKHRASVSVLPLERWVLTHLQDLGIATVEAFQNLAATSVKTRFGEDAMQVYTFLRDDGVEVPLADATPERQHIHALDLPFPVRNRKRLLPYLEQLLQEIYRDLLRYGESAVSLVLTLTLEDGVDERREIRPAHPTRDPTLLVQLVQLYLEQGRAQPRDSNGEHSRYTAVVRCAVTVETGTVTVRQGRLFAGDRSRDGAEVERAVSLLRARFGNAVVGRFVLRDSFRPEDTGGWDLVHGPVRGRHRSSGADHPTRDPACTAHGGEHVAHGPEHSLESERSPERADRGPEHAERNLELTAHGPDHTERGGADHPTRDPACTPSLVRRAFFQPPSLPATVRRDGMARPAGSYLLSGEWWHREYRREYHYLELRDGRLLWVYRDELSGNWMLQGIVE